LVSNAGSSFDSTGDHTSGIFGLFRSNISDDVVGVFGNTRDGTSDVTKEAKLHEVSFSSEEFINFVGNAGSSFDTTGNGTGSLLGLFSSNISDDVVGRFGNTADGTGDVVEEIKLHKHGFSSEEFINFVGNAGSSLDSTGNGTSS
jgi:cAMP phosphodiesterase